MVLYRALSLALLLVGTSKKWNWLFASSLFGGLGVGTGRVSAGFGRLSLRDWKSECRLRNPRPLVSTSRQTSKHSQAVGHSCRRLDKDRVGFVLHIIRFQMKKGQTRYIATGLLG